MQFDKAQKIVSKNSLNNEKDLSCPGSLIDRFLLFLVEITIKAVCTIISDPKTDTKLK